MEWPEFIENLLALIAIVVSILLIYYQVKISRSMVLLQLKKNKNLETIKYISTIRKEIWELTEYKKMNDFVKQEKEKDTVKVRAVKQKLEYMAAAINNDDLNAELIKNFCGRWFQSVVRILKIGNFEKEEYEKESDKEIITLYDKLDALYNEN